MFPAPACRGGQWGDAGYVKVQMTDDNIGACGMYTEVLLPLDVFP